MGGSHCELKKQVNDDTARCAKHDMSKSLLQWVDTHVKPLIWVEATVENCTQSKIEFVVKART